MAKVKTKRLLGILLALVMVIGMLPAVANAANKVKGHWYCSDGNGFIKAVYINDKPFTGEQEFEVGTTVKITVESIPNYRPRSFDLMDLQVHYFSESGNATFTIPDKDFTVRIGVESLGYVVEYRSDGRALQEICYDYGAMITIKHPSEFYPPLEKEGYDFLGWTESYSGTEVKYRPGDEILAEKIYARNGKTLYALWKEKVISVTPETINFPSRDVGYREVDLGKVTIKNIGSAAAAYSVNVSGLSSFVHSAGLLNGNLSVNDVENLQFIPRYGLRPGTYTETITVNYNKLGDTSINGSKTITLNFTVIGSTPTTHRPGDVNDDGIVNAKDKAILNRYLAGWEGYDAMILNWDAADINKDRTVNAKDKAILNRYLAGWEGYESYFES